MQFDPVDGTLTLGVGELVRHGTRPPIRQTAVTHTRLAIGTREHATWQAARKADESRFRAELPIECELEVDDYLVHIDGRIDGLTFDGETLVIEELKTVALGDLSPGDRAELDRAIRAGERFRSYRRQVEIYALMIEERLRAAPDFLTTVFNLSGGETRVPESLRALLVLEDIAARADESSHPIELDLDLEAIREELHDALRGILAECAAREDRRLELEASADSMPFPFERYRPLQRELVETCEGSLAAERDLLLSAPTGIGKTAAILFAALRHALPRGLRVFWVTAKTTQQRLVAETFRGLIERMRERRPACDPASHDATSSLPRALVLRAREKSCPTLDDGGQLWCHEDQCAFARDYVRKSNARELSSDLAALAVIDPASLYELGRRFEVCPYELSVDLLPDADLVIADYNYVFKTPGTLQRLRIDELLRDSVLVIDEAQNLYSRGREYASAAVSSALVTALREWAMVWGGELLEDLLALGDDVIETLDDNDESEREPLDRENSVLRIELDRRAVEALAARAERMRERALRAGLGRAEPRDPLERLVGALRSLATSLRLRDDGAPIITALEHSEREQVVRSVCVDPALVLRKRLDLFRGVIAFSATLEPLEFFREVLGFRPERSDFASFPSPFAREQRGVFVVPTISTTFRARRRHAGRVASLIDSVRAERRGNYLVFFSSYSAMREVLDEINENRLEDDEDIIIQRPSMGEAERDEVLELLREPDSDRALFGVHGGIFAEGVDYPGEMAVGVIVVGPGLPRFDWIGELTRAHFDELHASGFEYAYLYPGMHRVIQAAGRVIRSANDVGVVILVGERFAQSSYSALFPEDWYEKRAGELVTRDLERELRDFWKRTLRADP